ncbi:tellurite resistance/C4-dicarboxylate transporter family protein [Brachybacterium sp. DNPG3]
MPAPTLARRIDDAIADLPPGSFALVMATGIVGIGVREAGIPVLWRILLVIALVAYAVLLVLSALRLVRHPERVRADLRSPAVAFSSFTLVAGTDVLAVGLLGTTWHRTALALLVVGAAVWFVLGYVLPWQVLMMRDGRPILARANGTWFIWSVASQSLAVGLAAAQPLIPGWSSLVGILAVLSWSVGTLLYVGIALLVILRIVHFGITPEEFEPPYWVAMGALAIAVVAGAGVYAMDSTPMVDAARALIGGTVVIFWCFAAWLIPMLVGAGFWRHAIRRVPLRYTPALWSMVFPLGMFSVASMRLGSVEHLPVIESVGTAFLGIAILAWLLVGAGLVVTLVRGVRGVPERGTS